MTTKNQSECCARGRIALWLAGVAGSARPLRGLELPDSESGARLDCEAEPGAFLLNRDWRIRFVSLDVVEPLRELHAGVTSGFTSTDQVAGCAQTVAKCARRLSGGERAVQAHLRGVERGARGLSVDVPQVAAGQPAGVTTQQLNNYMLACLQHVALRAVALGLLVSHPGQLGHAGHGAL